MKKKIKKQSRNSVCYVQYYYRDGKFDDLKGIQ